MFSVFFTAVDRLFVKTFIGLCLGAWNPLDCSQSPIFSLDRRCRSLSPTGRHLGLLMRAKLRRVQNVHGWGWWRARAPSPHAFNPVTPTHRHFVLSSFAHIKRPRWQPVRLNDRHLRSHGKIGNCEQSRNPQMDEDLVTDLDVTCFLWSLKYAFGS